MLNQAYDVSTKCQFLMCLLIRRFRHWNKSSCAPRIWPSFRLSVIGIRFNIVHLSILYMAMTYSICANIDNSAMSEKYHATGAQNHALWFFTDWFTVTYTGSIVSKHRARVGALGGESGNVFTVPPRVGALGGKSGDVVTVPPTTIVGWNVRALSSVNIGARNGVPLHARTTEQALAARDCRLRLTTIIDCHWATEVLEFNVPPNHTLWTLWN